MEQPSVYGHIDKCQVCSSANLKLILDLGHQPRVHGHLDAASVQEPETKYPLRLCCCLDCRLVQLDYLKDPQLIFPRNYPYQVGMTAAIVESFRNLAETAIRDYKLHPEDLVVDIGSNDGTLLKGFRARGIRVLGIDPNDSAELAISSGIPTLREFFNEDLAREILAKHGPAKVIAITYTFALFPDLFEILKGIKLLLADDGVFISDSQYLPDIIGKLQYDAICDEQLRYYAAKPLEKLFAAAGFTLVDAERTPTAGGSIRAYAMKGSRPASSRLVEMIATEEAAGLDDLRTLEEFAASAIKAKWKLMSLLIKCKDEGGRIAGIGAPARSNTLLGFARIDHHLVDYICERKGSPKIGLFTPESHIPVVDEERLIAEQPEYALVLSWHLGPGFIQKIRDLGYQGKFIVPLPRPEIV